MDSSPPQYSSPLTEGGDSQSITSSLNSLRGPRDYKRFRDCVKASQAERLQLIKKIEGIWEVPDGKHLAQSLPDECYPAITTNEDGKLVRAKHADEGPAEVLNNAIEWPSNLLHQLLKIVQLTPNNPAEAASYLLLVLQKRRERHGTGGNDVGLTGADCKGACKMVHETRGTVPDHKEEQEKVVEEGFAEPREPRKKKIKTNHKKSSKQETPSPSLHGRRTQPKSLEPRSADKSVQTDPMVLGGGSNEPSSPEEELDEEQIRIQLVIAEMKLKLLRAQRAKRQKNNGNDH